LPSVFISYSRRDIAFARILVQAMEDRGLEPWIDWEDIPPSADWLAEVYQAIEGTDTFVFIVSQASIQSEVCAKEIAHANENHKRLIPVVLGEIDPRTVPPAVAALNWIIFRDPDGYQEAFDRLLQAIETDLPWVRQHTRLQVRALEWEHGHRDASLLLRGKDLKEAEGWLGGSTSEREPPPTALQSRYLRASREHATRRKRLTVGLVGLALLVTLVLTAVPGTNGARQQERQPCAPQHRRRPRRQMQRRLPRA
jgi:hypothetical protein